MAYIYIYILHLAYIQLLRLAYIFITISDVYYERGYYELGCTEQNLPYTPFKPSVLLFLSQFGMVIPRRLGLDAVRLKLECHVHLGQTRDRRADSGFRLQHLG